MALYYPPTANGLQKTLGAQLDQGTVASVTLNNTTNIQNKAGVFVVDRVDSGGTEKAAALREYISFTGVSGSTLTGLTRGLGGGGADQDHAVGAVVEFVPDVVQQDGIMDALDNLVTSAGALDTTKVADLSTAQAFTNKTITAPILGGTVTGTYTLGGTPTLTSPVINTGVSGTAILDEDNMASNSATKLATQQSIKAYVDSVAAGAGVDGWVSVTGWSYASATSITVTAGAASIYSVGDKIRFQNNDGGTYLYAYVVAVADTTLTVKGDTVPNATLTDTYYSKESSPLGFPQWFAYTPTGPSNCVLAGRFRISGRQVFCRIKGTFSNTTTWSDPTLPVTASSNMDSADPYEPVGQVGYLDSGTGNGTNSFVTIAASATTATFKASDATAYTASAPITWAASDVIWAWFSYEI